MKKKQIGSLKLFLLLLFTVFFVTFSNYCHASSIPEYNSSLDDTFISYDAYDTMLLYVGLSNNENYNTGESRNTKINIINNFITEWNDTYTTKISLKNLFFYKGRNGSNSTTFQNLNWFIVKDQDSTNFITSINITQNVNSGETMYRPMYFDTYLHNASGEISGISEYSATVYQIAQNGSSYTSSLSTANSSSYLRVQYGKGIVDGSDLKAFHFYDACYFGLNGNNTNDWYQLIVPGHTLYYGYGDYHITNEIILDGSSIIPTPTPVPTGSGGNGGDGGGTIIINGGMTSGEFIQGQEDFWGNSSNISGDAQIDSISGDAIALINSLSGDFHSIGFIGLLEVFESSFLDLLSESDTQALDLVISWNNVHINLFGQDFLIIPSGDLNFSKLCRDNSTLALVQTTIRVLFNFFFGFNLLAYLYNLVLSTLGIDNPFLYENPERVDEHILYDINEDSTTEISTKTYHSLKRPQTISYREKRRYIW